MILKIDAKIDGSDKYNKRFRIHTSNNHKYKVSGENVLGTSQTCSGSCNVSLTSSSETDIKIYANKLHIDYGSGDIYEKGSEDGILKIRKWGDIKWTSFGNSFHGANNLTVSATDNPDLSNVTDMSGMFYHADSFNGSINDWNTGNVEYMVGMFWGANSFNKNLDNWNTSNVETMERMFRNANTFNKDISNWNTSNVENMDYMFYKANNFNKNLSEWDVKKVGSYGYFGLNESKSPNWNNS